MLTNDENAPQNIMPPVLAMDTEFDAGISATDSDAGAENGENDAVFDAEISANPESGSVAPVRNPPIGWDENRVRPGVSYIKLAPFRYLFVTLTNRSPS